MRIPFPTSIPLVPALFVLSALLAVQLIEGTDPMFAVLMLAAQVFAVMTFNSLGGFSHPSGIIPLFSVMQNITVPEIAHAFVFQPGDYRLINPIEVAGVCALFYIALYLGAQFLVLMPTANPVFDRVSFSDLEMRAICWFAPIISVLFGVWLLALGTLENGSLAAALFHFAPGLSTLSVVLATQLCLKKSRGTSAIDGTLGVILGISTLGGILNASKSAMLLPGYCWLFTCAAFGYRFKRGEALGVAGVLVLAWVFVFPFAGGTRAAIRGTTSFQDKFAIFEDYLKDPGAYAQESTAEAVVSSEFGEATDKVNIVGRFSLLGTISWMCDADNKQGYTGIGPYLPVFVSIIPHIIWPDRPEPLQGNGLAHKAGVDVAADDVTTGITIGSPGSFFDIEGWLGLPIFTFLDFGMFFFVLRSLFGKANKSIWSLMVIGTIVIDVGGLGPSDPISLLYQYITTFVFLVTTLKVISFVSASMATRRSAQ